MPRRLLLIIAENVASKKVIHLLNVIPPFTFVNAQILKSCPCHDVAMLDLKLSNSQLDEVSQVHWIN